METKSQKVRDTLAEGDRIGALRIAANGWMQPMLLAGVRRPSHHLPATRRE
jgi:hypothetical protein